MKYFCEHIIVVEGKADEAFLSSFINAVYVKTNGYSIEVRDIEFINQHIGDHRCIILTDPDEAGLLIREHLHKLIPNGIDVEIPIEKCNKNNKHGIAESDEMSIIDILKEYLNDIEPVNSVSFKDLIDMGVDNKAKRDYLSKQMKLGVCNNKTLIKRLNYIKSNKKEIQKVMESYCGD